MSSISNNCVVLPSVTKSELDNLGPGCYVKIKSAQGCCWAEIAEVQGKECVARVHNELSDEQDGLCKDNPLIHFDKAQIVDLGCDNYCWC